MTMSERELEPVVAELATRLVGRRLADAWQPARDRVVLGFQDGTLLLLVPRGPDARVHTIARRPPNPRNPFSFQGALRARLTGPLAAMRKAAGERVVEFDFSGATLHLRLTGRSGGLWLCEVDPDGMARPIAAFDGPAPDALPPLPPGAPRPDPPRFGPVEGSWDRGAAAFFDARARARREAELRMEVDRLLQRAVARADRLRENLEDDLVKAEGAGHLRACADTLAAHLTEVERGPDHVDLPAWDDPTRTLRVPLVPELPVARSMDRLYQRARRLERMGDRVLERLDAVERELASLRAQRASLPTLDPDRLTGLRDAHRREAGPPREAAARTGVTTWTGPGGQRVLVGRDARSNRRLTFQLARGSDWWMHLRGRPGAHLVMPMDRGRSPPLELLLAAAQIAAVHGGLAVGEKAEVQYTRVRDVKAVPGSDGGAVTVHGEGVLHVARDPDALAGWTRDG